MSNAGKKVRTHYKGFLDDGTIFDSSAGRDPLEFTCMAGQMIPGFDKAVEDMEVGEVKTVHIPAADAYGEHNPDAIQAVPTAGFVDADKLPVGQRVYLQGPGGQPIPALVVSVDDEKIVFDLNHELAGKDLNFEIQLVEVLG
jgi:FKBP-type peptidyl-prolyl cis-trans isomerase 2